jgi:hypothetical protein
MLATKPAMDTSVIYEFGTWLTDQLVFSRLFLAFVVTAILFLLIFVLKLHRQNRRLHQQLIKLKGRVDALQAEDYRTVMRSLKKRPEDLHVDATLAQAEGAPVPSKLPSSGMKERGGPKGGSS